MPTVTETCENCGRSIGRLEEVHLWQERTVCVDCMRRLRANTKIPPGGPTPRKRLPRQMIAAFILVMIVIAGISAALVFWMQGSTTATTGQQEKPHVGKTLPLDAIAIWETTINATTPSIVVNATGDYYPGISGAQSSAIIIRNDQKEPITIQQVRFNGEYIPKIATLVDLGVPGEYHHSGYVGQIYDISGQETPVTLTVGEKLRCFHRANFVIEKSFLVSTNKGTPTNGYEKDVLFVDIVTDRGAVRLNLRPEK